MVPKSTKKRCKVTSTLRFQIHLILGLFWPPPASESGRCRALNLDSSLGFAMYYANRVFSFLIASASSFAPPWARFWQPKQPEIHLKLHPNTCRNSSRFHPLFFHFLVPFWSPFWDHFGTIFQRKVTMLLATSGSFPALLHFRPQGSPK